MLWRVAFAGSVLAIAALGASVVVDADIPSDLAEVDMDALTGHHATSYVAEKVELKASGKMVAAALKKKSAQRAAPVDENNQIEDDLTRSGLIGGRKNYRIDHRSIQDVDDELAESLVIDYQMDNTLFPTMDHSRTPYAKNAPPLEYVGLAPEDRHETSGPYGWVRDLDTYSNVNASGYAFEKGQGFWIDFSKWHQDAMPSESYTIDIVFKFDEATGMKRIFSKSKDSEEGLYVFDDKLVFWPHILKTNPDSFKMAGIKEGEWVRVTLVRDGEEKEIKGYVNGKICWALGDPLGSAVLPKEDRLNLFQDDQGYSSSGILGRVRVYGRALDDRHVELMGRHSVDAVYRHYVYGRRIYRNLVVADYQLQNSLISSVFTEYPLFINNRTFIDPEYVEDVIEGRGPKIAIKVPRDGFTYAIDETARIHNFDGEEYTLSVVTKLQHVPDRFQNILSWSNQHSEITLRVLNSQLILATRDRGADLHLVAKSLFEKRQKGATEVGERQSDYLQSSQNELLRLRLERRQTRIADAEIEEARIREVEVAKAEQDAGAPASQKAQGPAPQSYWQIRDDEKALRVAAGLSQAADPKPARILSAADYAAKQYQWELDQAAANEAERKAGTGTPAFGADRAAAARAATLLAQRASVRASAKSKVGTSDRSGYGPEGPPEVDSTGAVLSSPSAAAAEAEGLADDDAADLLLSEDMEESDLLYLEREANSERQAQDLWESEIKAHIPKTSTEQVDKLITECFMRGGKWRFSPIDKCSLDVGPGDLDEAPRPYDEVFDLASSMTASVKADKWVAITITRSLEGIVQCYVNGRRAFQFTDRNTTSTEIGGDSFKIFTPDEVAPVNLPGALFGRLLVYDQNLRSTEIREMVMSPKWSPTRAINIDRKTGNIQPHGAKETLANCITFLPIWNARSTAVGADHGATMLWIKNACKKPFSLQGTMCDEPFTCKSQPRGWMSCGTIVDSYCMKVGNVTILKDIY